MTDLKFLSTKHAIQLGNQHAAEWLSANQNEHGTRRHLANQHSALAKQASELAVEMEAESEPKLAETQRQKAAYHIAFADRLATIERTDLNMSQHPNGSKKFHLGTWLATGFTSNLIYPLITMISVIALGVFFGWPSWMTLIGAGIGARVVAERTGAGRVSSRLWGIGPTVPMILGWYWIPALAVVVHIWAWKHPGDQPQPDSNQKTRNKGKDDLPDEV